MQQYFGPGGAAQGMAQLLPQLLNWTQNPASNPAMTGIQTSLGAQDRSTVNTLQGDLGAGSANPSALATRLLGQANTSAGQYAAEAIPGLQQTALGGAESIFGSESGGLSQGLSATQNLETQYANQAAKTPNPFSSLATLANSIFQNNNSLGYNPNTLSPLSPNALSPVNPLTGGAGGLGISPTGGGNPFSGTGYQAPLSGLPPAQTTG